MDTDHITILQRQSGTEFASLARHIRDNDPADIAFSVVGFHEQVMGCHVYLNRARRREEVIRGYAMLDQTLRNYSVAPVLGFDSRAADKLKTLETQSLRVATMDLRIAAIALTNGLILLTRNVRNFGKVQGLVTEDWTA
jgi:tRNA(fMet)-specific endonuclease VapC